MKCNVIKYLIFVMSNYKVWFHAHGLPFIFYTISYEIWWATKKNTIYVNKTIK